MKRSPCRRCGGFTMIELMAAMALLIIITVFVGRIFSDTSKIWRLGNRRIVSAMDGRAVIDFMVRELSGAVGNSDLVMFHDVNSDPNVLGMDSDRIYFVNLANRTYGETAAKRRHAIQVSYHVSRMTDGAGVDLPHRWRIMRAAVSNPDVVTYQCYSNKTWYTLPGMQSGNRVLAENVRTLEFWVYDQNGQLIAGQDYNSAVRGPPGWVEIYIEMLSEEDGIKAALLTGQDQIDFADRASRRYVGRVFFQNGRGYAPDT